MPVYLLRPEIVFPDPEAAGPDGLLAVGGDLSRERLLAAYRLGIFPWYEDDRGPILWWSPDPRPIVAPDQVAVPSRLARVLRSGRFTVTLDRDFQSVISACAVAKRAYGRGTWITGAMIRAYHRLHQAGYAHSAECWREGRLVGGVYGVSLGRAFFGESMFYLEPDASKAAFVTLARQLERWDFAFIDCQQDTPHMARFGARCVPRREFLARLEKALEHPDRVGRWEMETARTAP